MRDDVVRDVAQAGVVETNNFHRVDSSGTINLAPIIFVSGGGVRLCSLSSLGDFVSTFFFSSQLLC